jgi:hypothetical protein
MATRPLNPSATKKPIVLVKPTERLMGIDGVTV